MGHPGKLLSSQVVAIQWLLLQGDMLGFVKTHKLLYPPRNSERVCTSRAQRANFRRTPMCLRWEIVGNVSAFGCVCTVEACRGGNVLRALGLGKVLAFYLTNIQLTPCTCMLVISSKNAQCTGHSKAQPQRELHIHIKP